MVCHRPHVPFSPPLASFICRLDQVSARAFLARAGPVRGRSVQDCVGSRREASGRRGQVRARCGRDRCPGARVERVGRDLTLDQFDPRDGSQDRRGGCAALGRSVRTGRRAQRCVRVQHRLERHVDCVRGEAQSPTWFQSRGTAIGRRSTQDSREVESCTLPSHEEPTAR